MVPYRFIVPRPPSGAKVALATQDPSRGIAAATMCPLSLVPIGVSDRFPGISDEIPGTYLVCLLGEVGIDAVDFIK